MSVTIYHHAHVHSHADAAAHADALAVAAGRLLGVGRGDDLTAAFPRAHTVDLQGLHVFPGLIDAHLHFVSYGLGLLQVELRETRSIAEAVRLVARRAQTLPPDAWALGRGWDKSLWVEDWFPTRHDLDGAAREHPVALSSKDGHVLWVNTAALRLAGLTRNTPDPLGGAIGRDESGEPDGILKEEGKALIHRVIPPPTSEMREQAVRAASADFHRLGLTGVHAFTGSSDEGAAQFEALQHLHDRGELAIRVTATVPDRLLEAAAQAGLDRKSVV